MRRTFAITAATALLLGGGALLLTAANPAGKPRVEADLQNANQANNAVNRQHAPLPMSRIVLFSSGVGYFQRDGEVEDSAKVELSFPATAVNDLLKSLVVQDRGGGSVSALTYDSQEPLEKTLRTFALDLTANPTFGELLNQARGEKVEVLMTAHPAVQTTHTGVIVGIQSKPGKDNAQIESLNLLGTDGLRSLPLAEVQKVKFANPVVEAEFRRALAVLAGKHDMQKKTVGIQFNGQGKRQVTVGYVVENPIWKTSYRLVLGQKKGALQGWALVENTSDDDWTNVKMALVAGRPISFVMDLYQPLFVPRPTVEPELFASLRPPTYNGQLDGTTPLNVAPPPGGFPGGAGGQVNGDALRNNAIGRRAGQSGGLIVLNPDNRLSFEQLQQRQQALTANAKADNNNKPMGYNNDVNAELAATYLKGVTSAASAEEMGDTYQYTIDHAVSLPRQKSAMLPIVDSKVGVRRVSIYNEHVHAKFPLLGLRFKNAKDHLMQGPVTVFDGETYAGDARMPDLQPEEERLISYAIDLGTEVKAEASNAPQHLVAVKLVKGVLHASHKLRLTRDYVAKNRSDRDRTLIIEQPILTGWHLVKPEKPGERTRDVYRFEIDLPAGKTAKESVVEEQTRVDQLMLTQLDDKAVGVYIRSAVTGEKVKAALEKAVELRGQLADLRRAVEEPTAELRAISVDQARLRQNLGQLPADSAAYKRYVEKFDKQETRIENLQKGLADLNEKLKAKQKEFDDYLTGLTIE